MHALLLAALFKRAAVEQAVRLVMRTQQVAGISAGIEMHGRIVFVRGFGMANLGSRTPASGATVYRIGSLTKSFTAQAVLDLRREGKVRLDDDAGAYVSPFPWTGVTIGELLAQRSGIPSYTDTPLERGARYTPAQLIAAVAGEPLLFAPGTHYAYSNTNYAILGAVVEARSGMPFGAYLQQAVLGPMDLMHTAYGDRAGEARGYARDRLNLPVPRSSVSYAFAAAGMSSNVPDLLRWVESRSEPYYGFLRSEIYGYSALYATGNVDGYSAIELLLPKERDAVVLLSNADRLDLMPLAKSIVAAIETPKPETYAHGFGPPQNEDPRETAQLRAFIDDLRRGQVDRGDVTTGFAAALTPQRLAALQAQLAPGSALISFEFAGREVREASSNVIYRAAFGNGTRVTLTFRLTAAHLIDEITTSNW